MAMQAPLRAVVFLLALGFAAAAPPATRAQAPSPGAPSPSETWETALRLQLEAEKKCRLAAVVYVRRIPVAGLDALEGRIRCVDEREFDFTRARPHQKFTLQLCQPAIC